MIYPRLAVAIKRRMYRIDASDLVDLQRAASAGGHRITRFEALCSHVWKLLAQAVARRQGFLLLASMSSGGEE
jgi:hypothetical protein